MALSKIKKQFLTTWLLEAGMSPVNFFNAHDRHPTLHRVYLDTTGLYLSDLVVAGYITREGVGNDEHILTQKALDEIGGD